MRKSLLLFVTALAVLATPLIIAGQDAKLERGKYLVEEMGRCQECHTPRTETGEFDKAKWMKARR